MPLSEGRVGENQLARGVLREVRLGAYGETIVNDVGLGRYSEAARLGRLFTTFAKAITIATTHNSPIAATSATPVVGFLNISSNKAAVLIRVGFGTTSGTPAGGQAVLNVQPNAYPSITAASTGSIFNRLVGGNASAMRPLNNVALAGWPSAPAVQELDLLGSATAVASAGPTGPGVAGEDIAGSIIVPPAALCALMCGSGAGTTWIVNASLTWAEIEWPL